MIENTCSSILEYYSFYESYLETAIDNEASLIDHINQYTDNILTEGVADNLKQRITQYCQNFSDFIDNLFGRFIESLTNIIFNNKAYLEKYKAVILNRTPKHIQFSFNGDYRKAINRCLNTQLPVFNYDKYGKMLSDENKSDAEIVKEILPSGNAFQINSAESLANLLKIYFLAAEGNKKTEGYLDTTKELNWTDMYNYCYNASKIKGICNRDKQYLKQSTNAILAACNTKIKESGEKTQTDQTVNTIKNTTSKGATEANNATQSNTSTSTEESFKYNISNFFVEAEENTTSTNNTQQKSTANSGLNIDASTINTSAPSLSSSYTNRNDVSDADKQNNANQAANGNETIKSMEKMAKRWISICRMIIAAKCTVMQNLARDFMKLIRAHVRSHVGNDSVDNSKDADEATDYNHIRNSEAPNESTNSKNKSK